MYELVSTILHALLYALIIYHFAIWRMQGKIRAKIDQEGDPYKLDEGEYAYILSPSRYHDLCVCELRCQKADSKRFEGVK